MFNALVPAAGVVVLPVPRDKVHDLSPAQSNGLRQLEGSGWVLRPAFKTQCIKTSGGGLPPSMVVASGDTRSRNHRRRSPKMRVQNRCFQGLIPTNYQYAARSLRGKLIELSRCYYAITHSPFAIPSLEKKYERLRGSFHRLHREHFEAVLAMEKLVACANDKSVLRKVA